MNLSELIASYIRLPKRFEVELTGLKLDSRLVGEGDVFLACNGANFDGRDFVDDVIEKGAAAVLVDEDKNWVEMVINKGVPIIPISNLLQQIAKIAAKYFDYPAAKLWLIGVTGTNGKTSCCDYIAQLCVELGYKCGVSGTLGNGLYGEINSHKSDENMPATTPDGLMLQRIFETVRLSGAEFMAMEVSSHGLQQDRVIVNEIDVAVFTNLSRDHLDYHGSMEAYGEVKRKLFSSENLKVAVVNLDDEFSAAILNKVAQCVKKYTYSIHNQQADVYLQKMTLSDSGCYLKIVSPWGKGVVQSSLLGKFNVSNLLAVITAVMSTEERVQNVNLENILKKISTITPVKGRMEIVGSYPITAVVDYAHTPDALKNALTALREHFTGNVWCIFGCGGNRDKGKRPLMAEMAEKWADEIIVTDDNPREEPAEIIVEQIVSGFTDRAKIKVERNRHLAIEYAISNAEVGDVILIAGKGHEEYQENGNKRKVFSDVDEARDSLNQRFGKEIMTGGNIT